LPLQKKLAPLQAKTEALDAKVENAGGTPLKKAKEAVSSLQEVRPASWHIVIPLIFTLLERGDRGTGGETMPAVSCILQAEASTCVLKLKRTFRM
jgi:hypothetical protein